jgi:hypothetical protein
MSFGSKIFSLMLAVVLTLGCAAAVSAQQSLTGGGDSDFGGLRWELQNGRYIIGIGNGEESYSKRVIFGFTPVVNEKTTIEKLQLLLGSRLYLKRLKQKSDNCSGFFVEGDLLVQKLDMEYKDYVTPQNSETKDRVDTSISVLAGYKFIFSRDKQKGFTLELAGGERFNSGDDFHDYEVKSNEGIVMVNLGYTW